MQSLIFCIGNERKKISTKNNGQKKYGKSLIKSFQERQYLHMIRYLIQQKTEYTITDTEAKKAGGQMVSGLR